MSTDPRCIDYLTPVTFTEQQRARRMAGVGCPVCMPTLDFDSLAFDTMLDEHLPRPISHGRKRRR